jgi:hypothetical protein
MNSDLSYRRRWCVVAAYALAMGWVEAAVVYYLRTMVNRIEPYQPNPLPLMGGFGRAELIREAATLVMLLAVGILAGKSWRTRFGFAALAFGIWDISYYAFLKVLCGWPYSLFDWDILFLLPLPWWGPVLAPVLISLLMIAWGTVAGQEVPTARGTRTQLLVWSSNFCGIVLCLWIFMQDTLVAARGGTDAVRRVLPHRFDWFYFCIALLLMSAPVVVALRRFFSKGPSGPADDHLGLSAQPCPQTLPLVTTPSSAPES